MKAWLLWSATAGLLTLSAALGAPALAGDRAAAEALIDPVAAQGHVRTLADDALEGRAVGTAGNHKAGAYITGHLERLGLEPGGDLESDGKRGWYQRWEQATEREGRGACRNIVALRRGRAASVPRAEGKDHVVLGAHYDHVGRGEAGGIPTLTGPARQVHNGADDNASGSAALLEVAKAVASLDRAPSRTIVLVWFDGEEHGLWGSRFYCNAPLLPLERCAAMFNLDMVGRARDGRLHVIAAASAPGLDAAIVEENRAVGLTLVCDPLMVPNSDHFTFYGRRVPSVFFWTGFHADYHRPGDDWRKVNEKDLARIARLTFRAAMRVAEDDLTPAFAEVPDAPIAAIGLEALHGVTGADVFERIARTLYGGVEGLFFGPRVEKAIGGTVSGGLRVLYVEPGSAAERAGFQKGDTIVRVAGRAANGHLAQWRLRLLARAQPRLQIDVQRRTDDIRLTLERSPTSGDPGARPRAQPRIEERPRTPARSPEARGRRGF